jgi:hypothetical protein
VTMTVKVILGADVNKVTLSFIFTSCPTIAVCDRRHCLFKIPLGLSK